MCGVGVTREGRCADGMADVLTVTFFPYQERDGLGGLAVARGRGRGRGDWSLGTPGSVQEITYTVPADKCGLVIGKGKRQLSGFLSPAAAQGRGSQLSALYSWHLLGSLPWLVTME